MANVHRFRCNLSVIVRKGVKRMTKLQKYWLFMLLSLVVVSAYPLCVGFRAVRDMITQGYMAKEEFPQYLIPYTPVAIALITAVLLMPLVFKLVKRLVTLVASVLSLTVFFAAELLFENGVLVGGDVLLENWQMLSCIALPGDFTSRPWTMTAAEVLVGDYSPWFKLHFYLIAVLLIVAILNVLYGYAHVLRGGEKKRCKALAVQAVCAALFLGLCILACLTSFWRNGELTVSALSAFLMGLFFVMMGVTAGVYVGSFLLGRKVGLSILLPSVVAAAITVGMYVGELILLSGHLYRFGSGWLFDGLSAVVLAPIDLLIVLLSGVITAAVCAALNPKQTV